jgi:hypothetical protein
MKLTCGPAHDSRSLELCLPAEKKLGVCVSGGIDSTLLYYLLLKERAETKTNHVVVPIVVHRKEGSRIYARPIVERINKMFEITNPVYRLGVTTLPEPQQVASAVEQAYKILELDSVYVGVITNRPEHTVGFDPVIVPTLERFYTPFLHLEKSHIVDIYYQLGIQSLLEYTHSCDQSETEQCGTCNGCRERGWGFSQIGQLDPRQ